MISFPGSSNFLCLLTLLFAAELLYADEELERNSLESVQEQVDRVRPRLIAATVGVAPANSPGAGSGVIISPDGLLLSAAHVTGAPGTPLNILLADGREFPGVSLGYDPLTDASMAKIQASGPFPFQPAAAERTYEIGHWVMVAGHPGGPVVGRPPVFRLGRVIRAGSGSAFSDPLSSTAHVISGDSGGPIFNLKGEVIGTNSNISGPWSSNNHVPISVFRENWDRFLAGETISEAPGGDERIVNSFEFVEDPFASTRERFWELLPKHADTDEFRDLRERPRLLPLHQMQRAIDRWEPPEEPSAARLGIELGNANLKPVIQFVVKSSSAEKAGLLKGDEIQSWNGVPVATAADVALQVRAWEDEEARSAIRMEVFREGEIREISLIPALVPERVHFSPPVLGMVADMQVDGIRTSPNAIVRERNESFLNTVKIPKEIIGRSIVEIRREGESARIAWGTVVSKTGEILSKASLFPAGEENYLVQIGDREIPLRILTREEKSDLALLILDEAFENLIPVSWSFELPSTGRFVLSPTDGDGTLEVAAITRPASIVPEKGYDPVHTIGKTPARLGLVFDGKSNQVSAVEVGSPADVVGILEGDEVTHLDGESIEDSSVIAERVGELGAGSKLRLKILRGSETFQVEPILARPSSDTSRFDRRSLMVAEQLQSVTRMGGATSERSHDFPLCHFHHIPLQADEMGTPLLDHEGRTLGINIARTYRHRTVALTSETVVRVLESLREKGSFGTGESNRSESIE